MKTDRLLLVAIVAVMAAVVGYLFFSDEATPGGRGDAAALSASGAPLTTLGAFEEQKRLEQARKDCVEFELPADFKGRSAEDIANFFGQGSTPYRISTANGTADGFRAGQKIYAPKEWVAALSKPQTPAPKVGENVGEVTPGASPLDGLANDDRGEPARDGAPADGTPPVTTQKTDELAKKDEPAPAPRANDPSETARPWGSFLMRNVPASGGNATANPAEARALEASVKAKPTPGQSYRAQQGDTLWKIAEAAYGKGSRYKEIARANESLVGADGSQLRAGMVLRIP